MSAASAAAASAAAPAAAAAASSGAAAATTEIPPTLEDAKRFFHYAGHAMEGGALYQRLLPNIMTYYPLARPALDQHMASLGVGIKAAVPQLLDLKYAKWLRLEKPYIMPAVQELVERGQIRAIDLNTIKKSDINLTAEELVAEYKLPPPVNFSVTPRPTHPADLRADGGGAAGAQGMSLHDDIKVFHLADLTARLKKEYWKDEEMMELLTLADDSFSEKDFEDMKETGKKKEKAQKGHVIFLYDSAPDGSRPRRIIGFIWVQWTSFGKHQEFRCPVLQAYAVHLDYSWRGFGKFLVDYILRLREYSSCDYLIARISDTNDHSQVCLTKVGEKHARELKAIGVVVNGEPGSDVIYREIQDDDEGMLEYCLSTQGVPDIREKIAEARAADAPYAAAEAAKEAAKEARSQRAKQRATPSFVKKRPGRVKGKPYENYPKKKK